MSKNSNENEITISKIIACYNDLAAYSNKAQPLLDSFQSRYRSLPPDASVTVFLTAELAFVEGLIGREQKTIEVAKEKQEKIDKGHAIINAHLQQNVDRILKYPMLNIENSNNEELMHLFGAIDELDRLHWPAISRFLREVFPLKAKSPLEIIENQLWSMLSVQIGRPPPALASYYDMLRHGDTYRIDNAAFNATKEVAFFLNDTLALLQKVKFPEENEAFIYLKNLIDDFKLKEIKRKIN